MLFKLLKEKEGVLKTLNNDIVAMCPTDNIIQEAKEVYEKIVESLAKIDKLHYQGLMVRLKFFEHLGQFQGCH